jgi:hypothetical protein
MINLNIFLWEALSIDENKKASKKFPEDVNPERREFLETVTKGAFVIPAVISVMMLNQKLNLTTANAQSNDTVTPD